MIMELISCYIENFGQFRQQSFDFSDGITAFCESNGYGKTTVAAFIKAMFYGLESSRIRKDFTDRVHFTPFAGGKFGGSLVFELRGKEYKIERFFDETSDTKDSCKVFCNGSPCSEFGTDIGETIFGIDKQSFERLMFITPEDIEISSTSSINKKLNNVVQGIDNDGNFDKAIEILKEKQKNYKSKRGGFGLLDEARYKKIDLERQIRNLKTIKDGLPQKYERLSKLNEEIQSVNDQLKEAQKSNAVLENWDTYDRQCAEIAHYEAAAEEIRAEYPKEMGFPSELDAAKKALTEYNVAKARLSNSAFTGQDNAQLSELQSLFLSGTPSDDLLREKQAEIEKVTELQSEVRVLNSRTLSPQEEKLKKQFAARFPSDSEMERLDNLCARYKSLEEKSASTPSFVTESVSGEPMSVPKPNIVLLILGIVLLIAGIGVTFAQTVAGVIFIVAGVVALFVAAFLYLNKKSTYAMSQTKIIQKENPEKSNIEAEKRAVAEHLLNLILPYGYTLENGATYSVESLKQDVRNWRTLTEEETANDNALSRKTAEIQSRTEQLVAFFGKYDLYGDNFNALLSRLKTSINEYNSLQTRKEAALSAETAVREKLNTAKLQLTNYCNEHGLNFDDINSELEKFEKKFNEYRYLLDRIETGKTNLETFRTEKNLTVRPTTTKADIDALTDKCGDLRNECDALNREIFNDETDVENLDELTNEWEQSAEKIKEYTKTINLLETAEECLKEADQNLKDKYIKPIKDIFVKYALMIEGIVGEKVTMDSDFRIFYERNGQNRSEKYLSAGQKSIAALCFRLALIKNMYSGENPFLIMDDPFVALDAEHIEKCKALLQLLVADFQIIYFTCHESRKI